MDSDTGRILCSVDVDRLSLGTRDTDERPPRLPVLLSRSEVADGHAAGQSAISSRPDAASHRR